MTKHLLRRLFISTVLLVVMWFSPTALADSGNGAPLFETHCSGCHLNGGNIIRRGKNLKLKTLEKNGYDTSEAMTPARIMVIPGMPGRNAPITPKPINAVMSQ